MNTVTDTTQSFIDASYTEESIDALIEADKVVDPITEGQQRTITKLETVLGMELSNPVSLSKDDAALYIASLAQSYNALKSKPVQPKNITPSTPEALFAMKRGALQAFPDKILTVEPAPKNDYLKARDVIGVTLFLEKIISIGHFNNDTSKSEQVQLLVSIVDHPELGEKKLSLSSRTAVAQIKALSHNDLRFDFCLLYKSNGVISVNKNGEYDPIVIARPLPEPIAYRLTPTDNFPF